MKKNAAVVENGEVVNWIVVSVDDKGKAKGMKGHPLAGKIEFSDGPVGIGMRKRPDGSFGPPDDVPANGGQ